MGGIRTLAYDGNSWEPRAEIQTVVDGAVSDGTVPTAWSFTTGSTTNFGTERMRISSTGQVGIGVSDNLGQLAIRGVATDTYRIGTNYAIDIDTTYTGGWARGMEMRRGNNVFAGGTTGYKPVFAFLGTGGLPRSAYITTSVDTDHNNPDFQIRADTGNVEIANQLGIGQLPATGVELDVLGDIEYTGTITDVSDRRLKTDIKPLSNLGSALDLINQIDTYSFKMKNDDENKTEFGVMAQELEKLYPTLVHTANDDIGTKSVNYTGLITPIIEAVKEMKALLNLTIDRIGKLFDKVTKLEQENKALQAEVKNLKSQNQDIIKRLESLEANSNQQVTQ